MRQLPTAIGLMLTFATMFWWLWMLGVGTFLGFALWNALATEAPTPTAGPQPAATASPWLLVAVGVLMLGFGFLFRFMLRRTTDKLLDRYQAASPPPG